MAYESQVQKMMKTSSWYNANKEVWNRLNTMPMEELLHSIDYDSIPDYETFMDVTQMTKSLKRAGSNNLYGINHRSQKPPVPENRDVYGLTFFTRPQLNLNTYNCRRNRKFYNLLTTNGTSIQRFVRCTLDPRLGLDKAENPWRSSYDTNGTSSDAYNVRLKSPLVDQHMGFIPILTNNLISLFGWPDLALPHYESKAGLKGEQWILGDGFIDIFQAYSLDATFRNTRDEPIILLFQIWERYIAHVFEGNLSPYMDMMVNNEIDYNTRIYRLVLDETKSIVKKIAACGAAFPVNVPTGKMFDYSDESNFNTTQKEISIQFQCVGADYNDDITIEEFNWVSVIFHPDMRNMRFNKPHNMVKIPNSMLPLLNNRGYPWIDEVTLELSWWIDHSSADFNKLLKYLDMSKLGGKSGIIKY